MVEAVLILPVLIFLILGGIDLINVYFVKSQLRFAAEEGLGLIQKNPALRVHPINPDVSSAQQIAYANALGRITSQIQTLVERQIPQSVKLARYKYDSVPGNAAPLPGALIPAGGSGMIVDWNETVGSPPACISGGITACRGGGANFKSLVTEQPAEFVLFAEIPTSVLGKIRVRAVAAGFLTEEKAADTRPMIFDRPGTFPAVVPAGTYYVTMFGAGGGGGASVVDPQPWAAYGGGGGAFMLARCVFPDEMNELRIVVGAGGEGGVMGSKGQDGGPSVLLVGGSQAVSAAGGVGGGRKIVGRGGSSTSASGSCELVESAAGGAGGVGNADAASAGGGAGNSGRGGSAYREPGLTSVPAVSDGQSGMATSDVAVTRYSVEGGAGGSLKCEIPSQDFSDDTRDFSMVFKGYSGEAPGGGGAGSCPIVIPSLFYNHNVPSSIQTFKVSGYVRGVNSRGGSAVTPMGYAFPGGNGADGLVIISPELD